MRDLLLQVLSKFLDESKKPLTQNFLADLLRHELPDTIRREAYITDKYKVKGSPGAGIWAEVPWVAILDKEITDTPERQFYIVYLFDAEMNGVYLSLNQGWVQYEKKFGNNQIAARKAIQMKTLALQEDLKSSFDFSTAPITLHARNNLGKGYELGHICGKFYSKSQMPTDEILIDDLRNLIGVYREMKGEVGRDIFGSSPNNHLEINKAELEKLTIVATELMLTTINPATGRKYAKDLTTSFNIEADAGNQKEYRRIGKKTEFIVAEYERKHLNEIGKPNLAEKVKIVSENTALGYDVLSFDDEEKPKQIEVKGTRSNGYLFFNLTAYELAASKALDNYYLYHVHCIDSQEPQIGYIKHPVFESDKFCLEPKQFAVKYKIIE